MALEYTAKFPKVPSDILLLDREVEQLPKNPNISPDDIILFLDIDGVLHPQTCGFITDKNGYFAVEGLGLFRWKTKLYELVDNLSVKVKIVLHSSWRYYSGTYNSIPQDLRDRLVDTTDPKIFGRYASIVEYAKRHGVTKAVILDDAGDEFPYGLPELVPCMKTQGLSRQSTFNKAKEKLERLISTGTL